MKATLLAITAAMWSMATLTVQAIPVTGDISFSGSATLDAPLATATRFTGINADVLFGSTGSYSGVPAGTTATWTVFSFTSSSSVTPLWRVTVGSVTYSFDALSILVAHQSSAFLNITGSGVARISDTAHVFDADPTLGEWSITVNSSGSFFTFGNTTTLPPASHIPVSDGGTTVMLLGVALSGLALMRQKINYFQP